MNQTGVGKSRRQSKTAHNSQRGQDLFTCLPSEIILNILLRLPTPTIMRCKCVCKPWLNLLETREFVKSHLTKSVPGFAIFLEREVYPNPYKFIEFADEVNPMRHIFGGNVILNFDLPSNEPLHSSADGLLFLCTRDTILRAVVLPLNLFICNPITREYIKLPCPREFSSTKPQIQTNTFGFGVSRISGQYKVVRIFHECILEETPVSVKLPQSKCQVYTVGMGSWRIISVTGLFVYFVNAKGVFLNGNLHWLVHELEGSSKWISCFDLETELFSTFSPPCHDDRKECLIVCALNDCLCICDKSVGDEFVIWLMKEYGDEKSWTKEFVIRHGYFYYGGPVCPIKVFKNGDILMTVEIYKKLLYFSKSKTQPTPHKFRFCISAITFTPSFLPLKSFAMENVTSF